MTQMEHKKIMTQIEHPDLSKFAVDFTKSLLQKAVDKQQQEFRVQSVKRLSSEKHIVSTLLFAERWKVPSAVKGVYLLLSSADEIFYVGKAEDLKSRLVSHSAYGKCLEMESVGISTKGLKLAWINQNLIEWKVWRKLLLPFMRSQNGEHELLEKALIYSFRPKFNRQIVKPVIGKNYLSLEHYFYPIPIGSTQEGVDKFLKVVFPSSKLDKGATS